MTYDDVMELTIPVMESIFDGFEKNNQAESSKGDGKTTTLREFDAIKYMIANKDIF